MGIFIVTAVITILGVLDVLKIRDGFLTTLFASLIVEVVGAVILLFKSANFFDPDDPESILVAEAKAPSVGADIRLEAKDAERVGSTIQYENDEVMENIGYWSKKEDGVQWKFTIPQPRSFWVVVEQACARGSGGEYVLECGESRQRTKVVPTGSWQNFVRVRVGKVTLPSAGENILKLAPAEIAGDALMNVRRVILH